MASALPAPLKTPAISRFAQRAAQLEKARPVIAYWCYYYVVQLIIQKGLHTESDESMVYTTTLMDKLETWKNDSVGNDAILDDTAAQAYCEQFGLETFQRAENTMRANKVTATTADTFGAASTFLDLLGVWQSPLNPELAAKSKFAKFHALRIAKAIKEGQDPNASNPQPEPTVSPPPLDPDDPEVKHINSLQPTIEDVSDESRPASYVPQPSYQRAPPSQPPINTSVSPQPFASQTQAGGAGGDVSPLEADQTNDGYFAGAAAPSQPSVPTFTAGATAPALPTAPADESMITPPILQSPPIDPNSFYNQAPSKPFTHSPNPSQPPTLSPGPPQPPPAQFSPAVQPSLSPPPVPPSQPQTFAAVPARNDYYQQPSVPASRAAQPVASQPAAAAQYHSGPETYIRDDEAILAAQKHAKWAISALNFEDVETAVDELRIALQSLGAR